MLFQAVARLEALLDDLITSGKSCCVRQMRLSLSRWHRVRCVCGTDLQPASSAAACDRQDSKRGSANSARGPARVAARAMAPKIGQQWVGARSSGAATN